MSKIYVSLVCSRNNRNDAVQIERIICTAYEWSRVFRLLFRLAPTDTHIKCGHLFTLAFHESSFCSCFDDRHRFCETWTKRKKKTMSRRCSVGLFLFLSLYLIERANSSYAIIFMQTPIGHLLCLPRSAVVYADENDDVSAPTLFRKIISLHCRLCLVAIEIDSMTLPISYDIVDWIVRIYFVIRFSYLPRTRHRIYTVISLLVEWCINPFKSVRT